MCGRREAGRGVVVCKEIDMNEAETHTGESTQ
jgi:hypothetical protein